MSPRYLTACVLLSEERFHDILTASNLQIGLTDLEPLTLPRRRQPPARLTGHTEDRPIAATVVILLPANVIQLH